MEKRCYIAGAGDFCANTPPERDDYIIAADGGYNSLAALGVKPHIIVGDFDSIGAFSEDADILRHPKEKDDTDVMLAVRHGLEMGCDEFIINGGLGGSRLDHTLANIQILSYISRIGYRGFLVGNGVTITAVTNGCIKFKPYAKGYISVFCAGGAAKGVFLKELKYPFENATLAPDTPVGVSNEFTGETAIVKVCKGTLTVTWEGSYDWSY